VPHLGNAIAFGFAVSADISTEREANGANRGGKIFLSIAIGTLSLAAGIWIAVRSGAQSPPTQGATLANTLHLEPFVLNLTDPGQRSFLRVGVDLGLGRSLSKGEDAPALGPVRDTIIDVLGQGKADELLTAKGKEQLKSDLLHALQEKVPALGVQQVYFTEFLIQR
jgi:flagellar basal body-associated protein FliL